MELVFGDISQLRYARSGSTNEWTIHEGHSCDCEYCDIVEEYQYQCPHCGKRFSEEEIIDNNRGIDIDIKNSQCPGCDKTVSPAGAFDLKMRGYGGVTILTPGARR